MRESRTYGSVRGAHGNVRPYRDRGAQLPQRRFNRRLVLGLGAGESRHSAPKSLFVRRALCAERRLWMTCGR